MLRTTAICTKIEHSDSNQVSFVFFRPQETFTFEEGQFMFLEIPGKLRENGKVLKNAYSIGTTNKLLQENGEIGFIVKKASEDGVSNFLTQEIDIGYEIVMTGPLGHFVDKKTQSDQAPNYLLISIGSGVTPIYGLYDHLVNESKQFGKIANIFGERYSADVLPSIYKLFRSDNENIEHFLCLSREANLPDRRQQGYVQTQLDSAVEFLGDIGNTHVFLCGKPEMCDDVVAKLTEKGFEKSQFTIEKY